MKISNPLVGFTVSFLLIPNFLFGNQDPDGIEAGIETENQEQISEETNSLNTSSSIPQLQIVQLKKFKYWERAPCTAFEWK